MGVRNTVGEQWNALLDAYSVEFQGKRARLEVAGAAGVQHVIVEGALLQGIGADLKDGEHSVTIMLETPAGSWLNHAVADVTAIEVLSRNNDAARIEITSDNGTTTVLSLH